MRLMFGRIGLTLLVMAIILFLAANTLEVDELETTLADARYGYLIPSSLLNVITVGVIVWRWHILLGRRAQFWDCMAANQIGAYLNTLLPMRLGDFTRAYVLRRHVPALSMIEILATIGAELTFDMLVLMLLLAAVLLVLPLPPLLTSAGAVLAIVTVVAVVGVLSLARSEFFLARIIQPLVNRLLPARFGHVVLGIVERMQGGLSVLRSNQQLVVVFCITVLGYAIQVISNWLLLLTFLDDVPLYAGLIALVGAGVGLALPLLPASTGTYQLAVALALSSIGIAAEPAAAYAVLLHAQQIVITLVMGNLFLLREGMSVKELRQAAQTA